MGPSSGLIRLMHFILRCEIIMANDIIITANHRDMQQTRHGDADPLRPFEDP
jgi:hypothetical protein